MAHHPGKPMAPHVRAAIRFTAQPKAAPGGGTAVQRVLAPHVLAAVAPTTRNRGAGSGSSTAQARGASLSAVVPRLAPSIPLPAKLRSGAQTIQPYKGHAHYTGKYVNRAPDNHSHDSKHFRWFVPEFVEDLPWRHMLVDFHRESHHVYRVEIFLYDGTPTYPPQLLRYVELRGPFKDRPRLSYVRTGYATLDVTAGGGDDLRIYADPVAYGSKEVTLRVEGTFQTVAGVTQEPPEGKFVFSEPQRDEPRGRGRARLIEFDVSEMIPGPVNPGFWPKWTNIRVTFEEGHGSIDVWVHMENEQTTSLGHGRKIKPGRIKERPRLNYIRKGLAAFDVMGGPFGEVRVLAAPVGVSPDTRVTLRVRSRDLFVTNLDPVTSAQVLSMDFAGKIVMAFQYSMEFALQRTMPHAQGWAEREEEAERWFRRLEDFSKNPYDVARYLIQMLWERPKKMMAEGAKGSLVNFLTSCYWARDVKTLREAGDTLAKEAIEIVDLILPK